MEKTKIKSRPRRYQKKLTLAPMTFGQAVDSILQYRPKPKKKV